MRPLELVREAAATMLVLEDPGGEPLDRLLGAPLDVDASCASRSARGRAGQASPSAASSTRTSSRQISFRR